MANPMLESSDDPRIGTAIAEYLVAVDSQQPLDIDAWLNRHAEIRFRWKPSWPIKLIGGAGQTVMTRLWHHLGSIYPTPARRKT
jgi:hypothetical protein